MQAIIDSEVFTAGPDTIVGRSSSPGPPPNSSADPCGRMRGLRPAFSFGVIQ